MRRWLAREGQASQRADWDAYRLRRRDFLALVARYRERLGQLYTQRGFQALDPEARRAAKRGMLEDMRRDYQATKGSWGGFSGYDRYFGEELNNALLAVVAAYSQWVPAFAAMIARNGGDMGAFYRDVRELAGLAEDERSARLAALSPPGR